MKFSRISILTFVGALIVLTPFVRGAKVGGQYPDPIVKESKSSVSDSIAALYFSEKYSNQLTGPGADHAHPNSDLTGTEGAAIEAFIKGAGDPSKKQLYEIRYGLDVDAIVDLLIAAKNAGIPTAVVTDLNRSKENNGTEKATDFAKLPNLDDGTAQSLEKLLSDNGKGRKFQYNDDTYGVFSIPVYAKKADAMIPIMHLKITLLVDRNFNPPRIQLFHSTGNMTTAQRVNTLIENNDPEVAQYYLDHMLQLIKTLKAGGEIKDMPQMAPFRMNYADGYRIVRFTDGQFNPNEAIAAFFTEAAQPGSGIQVTGVYGQEFVFTHRATLDALVALMKVQKDFRVGLVADSQFVALDGYGLASVLDGFNVYPEHGRTAYGVDRVLEGRTEINVYAKIGIGPDGKPLVERDLEDTHLTRKLEHNKIMFAKYMKNGEERARIWIGSLNLSNHFDNAEDQEEIDVPTSSWIFKALVQDYEEVKKQAMPAAVYLLVDGLRRLIGHSDLEVPIDQAQEVYQAILNHDYAKALAGIDALRALPTTLSTKTSDAEYQRRRDLLAAFLDWYKNKSGLAPSQLSDEIRLRKLISIVLVIDTPNPNPYTAQSILNAAVWRPGISDADLQKAITEAWGILKIKGQPNFEPYDPSKKGGPSPEDAQQTLATYGALTYWNFDWDDNIMFMPTPIVLFLKPGAKAGTPPVGKPGHQPDTWEVTTGEYAKMKFLLGKEGDWQGWETRSNSKDADQDSFYRFRRASTGNYFLDDILQALHGIGSNPRVWQGPSWNAFVFALSNRDTAQNVRIITARDHSAEEMLEGIKELQKAGLIRYLPQLKNIIGVGAADSPAQAKVIKLRESVQESEAAKIPADAPLVVDPSGKGQSRMMLWGFSDDDWDNYTTAKEAFKKMLKAGEIKQTKITFFFTDQHNPDHASEVKVIYKDDAGNIQERDLVAGEDAEVKLFIVNHAPAPTPADGKKAELPAFPKEKSDGSEIQTSSVREAIKKTKTSSAVTKPEAKTKAHGTCKEVLKPAIQAIKAKPATKRKPAA